MEGRFTTWLLLLASAALISHAAAEGNVQVGAILDLASVAGTRYQTSIRMAVEDYYSAHSNSTTGIELHFRDSSSDAVGAVSAGEFNVDPSRLVSSLSFFLTVRVH
jgi:glutamate receptor, ionotropic, plant